MGGMGGAEDRLQLIGPGVSTAWIDKPGAKGKERCAGMSCSVKERHVT